MRVLVDVVSWGSGTYRVGTWRLWSASLSCHDDLVNRQDCPGGLGSELDGPVLRNEKIEDALVLSVEDTRVVVVLGSKC